MNPGQRFAIGAFAAALGIGGVAARSGTGALETRPATTRPDPAAVRAKWERIITFFGEENTGRFSIRVLDRFVTETADFKYLELWVYDVGDKRWVKADDNIQSARIVLPKDKPEGAPDDSQLLADIPVTQETVGLYFCKWQVNGVDGVTLTPIGPGHVGKPPDLGKLPRGMIVADVPVDRNHGERMIVPDPRTHTGEKAH